MVYTDTELETLINEPREVSDRPYLLFTSYALNGLKDLVMPDSDDDYDFPDDLEMWGQRVPVKVLDRFLDELIEDFTSSQSITIHSKTYTIRKASTVNKCTLRKLFDFQINGTDYIVDKKGVMKLDEGGKASFKETRAETDANRTYLRKIIVVAEDDKHDGWNKLTDMEVAAYCWALFWNKQQINDLEAFQKKYKDWHGLSDKEVVKGWSDKCKANGMPSGMFTFSASNIKKWNEANDQGSVVDEVSKENADNYWFDTAIKTTFK